MIIGRARQSRCFPKTMINFVRSVIFQRLLGWQVKSFESGCYNGILNVDWKTKYYPVFRQLLKSSWRYKNWTLRYPVWIITKKYNFILSTTRHRNHYNFQIFFIVALRKKILFLSNVHSRANCKKLMMQIEVLIFSFIS